MFWYYNADIEHMFGYIGLRFNQSFNMYFTLTSDI